MRDDIVYEFCDTRSDVNDLSLDVVGEEMWPIRDMVNYDMLRY